MVCAFFSVHFNFLQNLCCFLLIQMVDDDDVDL